MADDKSAGTYTHSASDKKLDHAGDAAKDEQAAAEVKAADAGHDAGKERLVEGREQHDDAEKNSEKGRQA